MMRMFKGCNAMHGLGKKMVTGLSILMLGTFVSVPAFSITYYVSTTGNNSNDGLSWASAKRTVQAAVNAASHGDEIRVAQGTYNESITINRNVALKGGFAGSGADPDERNPDAYPTMLDGNQQGSVIRLLFNPDNRMVIEGFIIQNGLARQGAGISGSGGSPIIRNNVIRNNTATSEDTFYAEAYGGGIYFYDGAPRIERNRFVNNQAVYSGEAFSDVYGGAIFCYEGSPVIASNQFIENKSLMIGFGSLGSGGAVFIYTGGENAKVINNLFAKNYADGDGAGLWVYEGDLQVYNNTFVDNDCLLGEGAAVWSYECSLDMVNNIVAFNTSGVYQYTGESSADYNCNYFNVFYDYAGLIAGGNDIYQNPGFVDYPNGDYHLTQGSPCVDSGDDSVVLSNWVDMDGQPRIAGAQVDRGADEVHPIEGDVNGDGCVDDIDLLAVLFAFGETGPNLAEDLNNDGVVDDADLLIVLFNFGSGC